MRWKEKDEHRVWSERRESVGNLITQNKQFVPKHVKKKKNTKQT